LLTTAATRISEATDRRELRGAVIAVADRDSLLDARAFGNVGDDATASPLTVEHRFLLTSITKAFTTVQILQLVECGLLALDVPVADYIPEFGCNGKASITTRHILTHTSGLTQAANTVERSTPDMSAADHLRTALQGGLDFPPGERVDYCSPMFWVLAELSRRLTGRSHVDDLSVSVTRPCGMSDSGYDTGEVVDTVAAYGVQDAALPDQQRRLAYPAGAVVSTASDLARFGQALLGGGRSLIRERILAPVSVAAATQSWTDELPGNPPGTRRGLGFVIGGPGALRSARTFGHGGAAGTYLWIDPDCELVIVFLSAHWSLDRRLLAAVADSIVALRSIERAG
jgi:CubicO group peptidase (beta-lactamase class C family)